MLNVKKQEFSSLKRDIWEKDSADESLAMSGMKLLMTHFYV